MILIALGSNLAFCGIDSQQLIDAAIRAINHFAPVCARSALYSSPAWPDPSEPAFVNGVIAVETQLAPDALLAALQGVEYAFGRRRSRQNAPRTLDLDLLAYGSTILRTADLILPHPSISERPFVLAPLCDIDPSWRHPENGLRADLMLDALDLGGLSRIDEKNA